MAENIRVEAPGGGYTIQIDPGLLVKLGTYPAAYGLDGWLVVATNVTLAGVYGNTLVRRLSKATLVTMPDGEQYKTLDTVAKLYADFVAVGLDRSGTVLALGGGVVGDTAGFAAATYMR